MTRTGDESFPAKENWYGGDSPETPNMHRSIPLAFAASLLVAGFLSAADSYITPRGAGDQSGSSWENAATPGSFGVIFSSLSDGATLYFGSGEYEDLSFNLAKESGHFSKIISGVDTGGGLPLFRSHLSPQTKKGGKTLFSLGYGAGNLRIKDLRLDGYQTAVRFAGNHDVALENVDVTHAMDAFWIDGGAKVASDAGNRDLVFKDCDVRFFVKRGFRVLNGNRNLQFINCHVDAGGAEYAFAPFAIGFHIQGGAKESNAQDTNITFTGCSAANSYHNGGAGYWNGDGFASEGKSSNLTFIRCIAWGNTDGGWDLKSNDVKLVDCVGIQNKRNFRFWGKHLSMVNCLSAFAEGDKHVAGMWLKGGTDVTLDHCTFWESTISVEDESAKKPVKIVIKDSLIGNGEFPRSRNNLLVEISNSREGTDVQLSNPSKTWRGGDGIFDSPSDASQGFRNVGP
jgi:hypothetical protein